MISLLYAKPEEISLDSLLKFSYSKLSNSNIKNFGNFWKFESQKIQTYYNMSNCLLFNSLGEYIGCIESSPVIGVVWDVDISLLYPHDEEYFDFGRFKIFLPNPYIINKVGSNSKNEWIYAEIENKNTHYREYILNLYVFTNFKKYIRQEKINNLIN